jgi:hypothetical protein
LINTDTLATTSLPLSDVEAALDVLAAHGIRFGRIPTYGSHDVALTAGKPQMLAALHRREITR